MVESDPVGKHENPVMFRDLAFLLRYRIKLLEIASVCIKNLLRPKEIAFRRFN